MANHQIRRVSVVDEKRQAVDIIGQADITICLDNHGKVDRMIGQISQPDSVPARYRDPI